MGKEPKKVSQEPDLWLRIFLGCCAAAGIILAAYFIAHPVTH